MIHQRTQPRHAEEITWVEIDGEIVVLDLRSSAVHLLSTSAAVLFPLFDGTVTIEDLARDVSEVYGIAPDRAMDDVVRFVDQAASLGIVDLGVDGAA